MENGYKIVNNVIHTPNYEHQPDARGIGWVYYENLIKNKDHLAQIDGITGEEDTFGALKERCVSAAISMKKSGIEYGDVVSVCTSNHLNSCVPHIAAMFIGAKIAGLDPSLPLSHTLHLFKIVMPKLIFVDEASVKLIENVIQEAGADTTVVVFGHHHHHVSFTDFAKTTTDDAVDFIPTTAKSVKDVSVIMFSSGTTGFSKGICHTHYSLLSSSHSVMKLGETASFVCCLSSPFWIGFLVSLNHSILNGMVRVIYPKLKLSETWTIFTRKITLVYLRVSELMTLYNTPKPSEIDTSALKLVITGGCPISEVQIEKARRLFPNVLVRINYALTEVFSIALSFDVENVKHVELLKRKKNSCGLPKTGFSYKIVDLTTGEALGPYQKGELRLKTEMQMSGYYNMNSEDAWDGDGWIKTGDYGYYDEDCCFYIVDRIKEMFKYQYWHIIPASIEAILVTHPAVFKAVVIGVPHEVDVYHPMAVIQLKTNVHASEEEIRKFTDERVEDQHRLRGGVKFIKDFPLTASGKINRWELKQMIFQKKLLGT